MGLLDYLFQDAKQSPTLYPTEDQQYAEGRPKEIDYSQGIPMPYLGKKKTDQELMDADLKRFRESNPIPPEQLPSMAPSAPIPGLLGQNIAQNVPGNIAPQPPQAAPQLPPPVDVPPAPQIAPAGGAGPAVGPAAGPGGGAGPGPGGPVPGAPGAAPSAPPPAVAGGPPGTAGAPQGFLAKLDAMTQRNPALLFSLAAGFSGAPSFGTGMSRAFGNAPQALQIDQANAQRTEGIGATYRALVSSGVPPKIALAASQNPEILKQIGPDYLSTRKGEIKTIKSKDAWGNESEKLVMVNPYDGTVKEFGAPNGAAPGAPGSGTTSLDAGGKTTGVFAPGVTSDNFNHSAVGEDYLKQFAPEHQQAIKDYLAGRTAQTGRQMPIQMLKMAAQKYGNDIGMPADDSALVQRKEWAKSLGNTQSGVGLQAKGFQQGLEHFTKLSDALVKLNLSNGLGLEPLAGGMNYLKSLTTEQKEIINKANLEGQALAGEMGNLFSKNGGGVHERAEVKNNISNAFQSSKAAAGALEGVVEMMHGGLSTLNQRRDELFPLPGSAPRGSEFLGPRQQAALEHIQKNIAILKGEQPAAAAGAPAPAAPGAPAAPTSGVSPTLKVPWSIVKP